MLFMTPPTSEEIAQAHRDIDADGPVASTTLHLAALAMSDPTLKGILLRMKESQVVNFDPKLKAFAEAMLNGTLISGLNLGIRIGEARAARAINGKFVFCRDCGKRVEWTFSQDEIVCEPAHHIVATFAAKRNEAAS
jgi:hypothetical protein